MSVAHMAWVFKHSQATLADRLVLLAIADNANDDDGTAWPSIQTIARKAHVSERSAQRSIRALQELGELEFALNGGPGGVNLYRMTHITEGGDKLSPVTSTTSGGDRLSPRTIKEPSVVKTPSIVDVSTPLELVSSDQIAQTTVDRAFGEFWATYPRRVGKLAAERAFKAAAKRTATEKILAAAARYAAECKREQRQEQFIAHPATWLNAGRWDDETRTAPKQQQQFHGGW